MTTMERQILITHLVARAQDFILLPENEKMRINSFERTGCLITTKICDKDALVKPQGVTIPFVVPVLPPSDVALNEMSVEPEQRPESEVVLNIATIMQDLDLNDAELILDSDEDIVQEAEI